MLNQVVLVGSVKEMPVLKETGNGLKFANLQVEVTRGFKNAEGNYDSDNIQCTMWRGVAETCIDLCEVGSIVGIKGRIKTNTYTNEEGTTYTNYEVIAEKISFLGKKGENE